jgi:hypothetical protein
MKNKKPLFLLIASVALVIWGLVAMNRRDSSEQSPGQSGTPASEDRTAAPGGLDLLDVGTPASMPSAIPETSVTPLRASSIPNRPARLSP